MSVPIIADAETNDYPSNAEVSFYGEYESPSQPEKQNEKTTPLAPIVKEKQSQTSNSTEQQEKATAVRKTEPTQQAIKALPNTGSKKQILVNYLGFSLVILASFIIKKRKKEF